jgi:hypothetical protein
MLCSAILRFILFGLWSNKYGSTCRPFCLDVKRLYMKISVVYDVTPRTLVDRNKITGRNMQRTALFSVTIHSFRSVS